MNTKISIVGLLALGTAFSSCAPNIVGTDTTSNQTGASAYVYGQSDGSYNCPSAPNVVAPASTSTPSYTACLNTADSTKIKIVGYSRTDRMICAFPLQYSGGHLLYVSGRNGEPLSQCYDAWSSPDFSFEVGFDNTTYNGVIVVDQSSQTEMNRCLLNGTGCPAYSLGKIR